MFGIGEDFLLRWQGNFLPLPQLLRFDNVIRRSHGSLPLLSLMKPLCSPTAIGAGGVRRGRQVFSGWPLKWLLLAWEFEAWLKFWQTGEKYFLFLFVVREYLTFIFLCICIMYLDVNKMKILLYTLKVNNWKTNLILKRHEIFQSSHFIFPLLFIKKKRIRIKYTITIYVPSICSPNLCFMHS